MPVPTAPIFLVASTDPVVLKTAQAALGDGCAQVQVAMDAETARQRMTADEEPALAVIDEQLPGVSIEDLLEQAHPDMRGRRFPIVALVERATP
jgi:CheY-like chemotaxis protein